LVCCDSLVNTDNVGIHVSNENETSKH
jgi:hypothetical protein